MDFKAKYRRKWPNLPFAPYVEDMIHNAAVDDALAVIEAVLHETKDRDVRCENLSDALSFLEAQATRTWPFHQYRRALEMPDPVMRFQNLNAAINAVFRVLGKHR